MIACGLLLLTAAVTQAAEDLEPIHRDDDPQPVIELPPRMLTPLHKSYVLGHLETRHVDPRAVGTCMKISGGVINQDFMKCRNGYDYKVWVPGHYVD
jgi:hypothetical protein